MDLLVKTVIGAIIVAILISVAYDFAQGGFTQQTSAAYAANTVYSYLKTTFPGAIINITNESNSTFQGSWHILASVINEPNSPCPGYAVYSFDYPKYKLVYQVENVYTANCTIFGFNTNGTYLVVSGPVAVTRAYSLNITQVNELVKTFGFNNVTTSAQFYNSITIQNSTYDSVWLTNFSAKNSNYSTYVAITQHGGNAVANYTVHS